jgi:hypothetical protein
MFYAVIVGKHLTFNVDAILVFETVIVNEGEHSSADELNSGGGYPSGSMTALCKMERLSFTQDIQVFSLQRYSCKLQLM